MSPSQICPEMYLLSDSKSCQSLDLTPALSPALTGSEMLVWGPLSLPDPLCLVLRIKKVPCRACSACGGDTSEGLALQRPSPVGTVGTLSPSGREGGHRDTGPVFPSWPWNTLRLDPAGETLQSDGQLSAALAPGGGRMRALTWSCFPGFCCK